MKLQDYTKPPVADNPRETTEPGGPEDTESPKRIP